ncbi:uncharacterized protein F4812DRAFT_464705 [Daldinia caldariorum]|uniref:uncharacterized protein n=1 Tax=Daldinia caldariorum TaxID=326644 RepID=UPI002007F2B6|nr:uncharacterized protein F4812DRAFT_464705 [Daldinia caldariorum]KAI1472621.1 hypothetical protein F4812DRAFT_464705 [Daldinia caldariorum]
MSSQLYNNSGKPEKLIYAVDHEDPDFWFKVFRAGLPFILASGNCWNEGIPKVRDRPTRVTQPQSKTSIQFNLMALPTDIFLDIYDLVMEPYELNVYLAPKLHETGPPKYHTHMIIQEPRAWASMTLLQVSRTVRNLTIARYGQPHKNSLPFDPMVDKLVVLGTDPFYVLSELEPIVSMAKRIGHKLQRKLERNIINPAKLLCYYSRLPSENPRTRLTPIGSVLLDRVQHMEIRFSGSNHDVMWWDLLRGLTLSLPNLKHLRAAFYDLDTCPIEDEQEDAPPVHHYAMPYWRFVQGIREYEEWEDNPRLFPRLKSFEMWKTRMCSLEIDVHLDWLLCRSE